VRLDNRDSHQQMKEARRHETRRTRRSPVAAASTGTQPPGRFEGTVVIDHTEDASNRDLPPAYLVEFADSDGITQALVTLYEDDLEVVWRPDSAR
jgi:hypothetical protein